MLTFGLVLKLFKHLELLCHRAADLLVQREMSVTAKCDYFTFKINVSFISVCFCLICDPSHEKGHYGNRKKNQPWTACSVHAILHEVQNFSTRY